jgi:hypothetical protein
MFEKLRSFVLFAPLFNPGWGSAIGDDFSNPL